MSKINAIVLGATGLIGEELVNLLIKNSNYNKITIFMVKNKEKFHLKLDQKLKIIDVDNLDFLSDEKKFIDLLNKDINYDVLFNLLCSRKKKGKEEYEKVEYTYVVESCKLCEKLNISHFAHCSIGKNNIKKKCEEECLVQRVHKVSILKPAVISDRDFDYGLMENFCDRLSCNTITCREIALAMMNCDINYQLINKVGERKIIYNSEIKDLAQNHY